MQDMSISFRLRGMLAKPIIVIFLIITLMVTGVPATRMIDDNRNPFLLEQLPRGPVPPAGHSGCSHYSSPGGGGDCPSKAAFMESSAYPNYDHLPFGVAGAGAPPPPVTDTNIQI